MESHAQLYPLTFQPLFKERIWGGQKLKTVLGKDFSPLTACGESWELSAVPGNISVVKDGNLAGKPLTELINEYKGILVGEAVYQKHGNDFPLLIKFLDAQEDLSIQVHPNDALAQKRHNSFGKTEMWYVMQADPGSSLRVGFNRTIEKETYLEHLQNKKLDDILNVLPAEAGDVIFLPAGRVHSIGKGLLIAEIQQTSDITYRLYDFDRRDKEGKTRELHTEEALDAIDYQYYADLKSAYKHPEKAVMDVVHCPYFHTSLLTFKDTLQRDYQSIDSFVILIGLAGSAELRYNGGKTQVNTGDVVLVPAVLKGVELHASAEARLFETYIPA